jgi:hypothetical protein
MKFYPDEKLDDESTLHNNIKIGNIKINFSIFKKKINITICQIGLNKYIIAIIVISLHYYKLIINFSAY